jgi:hypothetical protein
MSLSFGNTATTPSPIALNTMRLKKHADRDVIALPTPASTQINPGDTLVWNSAGNSGAGCIQPVSTVAWDTNLQTTQTDALTVFVGIAVGQKDANDPTTTSIPVCIAGIATFPCAALGSAQQFGALVGPAAQGTHNLDDAKMVVVTSQAAAFGTLIQPAAAGAQQLQFFFHSTLIFGQLQAA